MQLIAVIEDVSCRDETSAQAVTLESLQPNHADCNAKLIIKREEAAWPSGQRVELAIWRPRVRILLWSLAGFVLGFPEFKSEATLVNNQLFSSFQLGFLILLCFV